MAISVMICVVHGLGGVFAHAVFARVVGLGARGVALWSRSAGDARVASAVGPVGEAEQTAGMGVPRPIRSFFCGGFR